MVSCEQLSCSVLLHAEIVILYLYIHKPHYLEGQQHILPDRHCSFSCMTMCSVVKFAHTKLVNIVM